MAPSPSTSSAPPPAPSTREEAVKQRDEAKAVRDRFERLVQQEMQFQAAAMPRSEMPSCTKLFDKYLSCVALFPQINAVYRYGSTSVCDDKLDDWKACLSLRGIEQDDKYRRWIRRRAERMAQKRLSKQSAEEVWSIRMTPEGAFVNPELASEDFPA